MNRVIIKGCMPADINGLLRQWPEDEVRVWGLNKQDFTWASDHYHWRINHSLEWFQLHGLRHMVEKHGEDYLVWLSGMDCPVWMFEEQASHWGTYVNQELGMDIPPPELLYYYPVETIVKLSKGRRYITNSFSYMVALAALLEADHIHLTGIGLGKDTEQLWKSRTIAANFIDDFISGSEIGQYTIEDMQRVNDDLRGIGAGDESWIIPNLEYWVGLVEGKFGVEFTVDPGHLFYDKWGGLYGHEAGGNE